MAFALALLLQDSAELGRLLKRTRVTVELEDTPLDGLAELAAEHLGKNVLVSPQVWKKFSDENLRFTIKLKEVSLLTLMRVTLRPKGLTVTFRNGVLTIVPQAAVADPVVTKMYDVRDYVLPLLNHMPPHLMVASIMTLPHRNSRGARRIFEPMDAADEQTAEEEDALDALQSMVEIHTGGNSWTEDPRVTLSFVNGKMIVTQTAAVQKEVRELLDRLGSLR